MNKYRPVFFEEIPTDDNAGSSTATADVVDDLNNDNAASQDNADAGTTGSDSDTNSGADDEGKKPVPYSRFKEVNDGLKTANESIAEMKTRLDELSKVDKQVAKADDKADESDDSGLSKEGREILKKNGFLTKAELDSALQAERQQIQAEQQIKTDVAELSSWAKKEGLPEFDATKVLEWADQNFGKNTIKSKQAFKSAYMAMNEDAINEARTKRALAEAGKPKAAAEKPGSGSGKGEPSSSAGTKGDIKSRTNAVLDRLEKEGKAGSVG